MYFAAESRIFSLHVLSLSSGCCESNSYMRKPFYDKSSLVFLENKPKVCHMQWTIFAGRILIYHVQFSHGAESKCHYHSAAYNTIHFLLRLLFNNSIQFTFIKMTSVREKKSDNYAVVVEP